MLLSFFPRNFACSFVDAFSILLLILVMKQRIILFLESIDHFFMNDGFETMNSGTQAPFGYDERHWFANRRWLAGLRNRTVMKLYF